MNVSYNWCWSVISFEEYWVLNTWHTINMCKFYTFLQKYKMNYMKWWNKKQKYVWWCTIEYWNTYLHYEITSTYYVYLYIYISMGVCTSVYIKMFTLQTCSLCIHPFLYSEKYWKSTRTLVLAFGPL